MKKLIIVCAGGFGKEALNLAQKINKNIHQWNILGFIDDTKTIGTEVFRGYKIIGSIHDWEVQEEQYFALGISKPQAKEKIYNLLKSKGAKFATLINPNITIPEEMIIGEGCIITSGWIGLNNKLGKCVHIAGSMIGGSDIDDFSTTTGFSNIAAAHIGKRVFVGSHAVVLNGRKVGDDAIVAAGAIVMSNVKAGTTVIGNPARIFKI